MKTNSNIILAILFCLPAFQGFSQKVPKPAIFSSYPSSIPVSKNILSNVFSSTAGETVSLPLGNNFVYAGTVVSNTQKYSNLQSVIIKSPAFGNALFQLTKTTHADNSYSLSGRIINTNAVDGYELKKEAGEHYRLQKTEMQRILQDCSY